jgi:hypothetical protein
MALSRSDRRVLLFPVPLKLSRNIRRLPFLLFFFCLITEIHGQGINGSIYSLYGIGNVQSRTSAYNRALGGTGIGVRDDLNMNLINPAAYNAINKPFSFLFEIGANYESVKHETGSASSRSKTGGLNSLSFLIKAKPKLGIVAGISQISTISYDATSTRFLADGPNPIAVEYSGSGGVNQIYLGSGYELFKNFSIGANLTYYLGTIKRSESIPATTVSPQLIVADHTAIHAPSFDAGFQYSFKIKETQITWGATYDPGVYLHGDQQYSVVDLNFDTLKKTDLNPTTHRLPPKYGTGIGVKYNRVTVAADARYDNWSQAIMNDGQSYQNSLRYSMGFEYRGSQTAVRYLDAIAFRGGWFLQDYPLLLRNAPFKSWGYTLGLSLPLDNYRASFNVNYVFSQLGTTKNGLIKESSNKLIIDVIIRDIWGVRRRLD